jgi:hypothetical protein
MSMDHPRYQIRAAPARGDLPRNGDVGKVLLHIHLDTTTRTILEDGQQQTGGYWEVSGGRSDFIAGIPLLVSLYFYSPVVDARGMTVLYTEFEVFDGKDWQRIVWRNIPIPK